MVGYKIIWLGTNNMVGYKYYGWVQIIWLGTNNMIGYK